MSLKLNSSGGGSVLLQEPSTASNRTLTLPDADGTVIYSDASANLQFNSGYGSIATAYGCRAWVNFNGTGTVAIRASANVTSITDNGTGDYTVNFTNAMPDANYAAIATISGFFGTSYFIISTVKVKTDNTGPELQSTTQVKLVSGNSAGTSTDVPVFNVAIFR
jgi:hypothetical protein